jgi:hypothetical protein
MLDMDAILWPSVGQLTRTLIRLYHTHMAKSREKESATNQQDSRRKRCGLG